MSEHGPAHHFKSMIQFKIEQLPFNLKNDVEQFFKENPLTPAARLRPDMGVMRHLWLAFVGPVFRLVNEHAAGLALIGSGRAYRTGVGAGATNAGEAVRTQR